jgi:5'-nucleotidase
VRILVTNDDGIDAQGLHVLARNAVAAGHDVVVVAPSADASGSGAAIGVFHADSHIDVRRVEVPGCDAPAWALAGPPGLCALAGRLGAFGPPPDLVLSGINAGLNTGRAILHSGTVGAALTASQLGISALAVSLRAGVEPDPWESAADLAMALLPLLMAAPTRTVLNLNVPALPLAEVRGLRWARVSGAGLIKSAQGSWTWEAPNQEEIEGPAALEASRSFMEGEPEEKGEIVLTVGSPFPHSSDLGLADAGAEDATLVAQGYAALTALRGPRADEDRELLAQLDGGLEAALSPFGFSG